jgi:hypothetical protein
MGYRSDVYVGMAIKDFKPLREQVGKRDGSNTFILDEWIIDDYGDSWKYTDDFLKTVEHDSFHLEEDYVYFHIGGIKWYDTDEPIRVFHETIEKSSEAWGMIIIGEESEDIQSFGDPWELDMILHRYVEMPGSYRHVQKDPEIKTDGLPPECGFPVNWVRIG